MQRVANAVTVGETVILFGLAIFSAIYGYRLTAVGFLLLAGICAAMAVMDLTKEQP